MISLQYTHACLELFVVPLKLVNTIHTYVHCIMCIFMYSHGYCGNELSSACIFGLNFLTYLVVAYD